MNYDEDLDNGLRQRLHHMLAIQDSLVMVLSATVQIWNRWNSEVGWSSSKLGASEVEVGWGPSQFEMKVGSSEVKARLKMGTGTQAHLKGFGLEHVRRASTGLNGLIGKGIDISNMDYYEVGGRPVHLPLYLQTLTILSYPR